MKAMITGASGFVGHHLADKLPEAVLVGRSITKIQKLFGEEREAREWDGTSNTDPSFLDGVDTIFHLAGESIFHGRWNAEKKDGYDQAVLKILVIWWISFPSQKQAQGTDLFFRYWFLWVAGR